MLPLQTIRRITIYAAQSLEEALLTKLRTLGVTGYTVVDARGVGTHGAAADLFARASHVRIELLVNPALVEPVMRYLDTLHKNNHPVTSCVDEVQVPDPEHY